MQYFYYDLLISLKIIDLAVSLRDLGCLLSYMLVHVCTKCGEAREVLVSYPDPPSTLSLEGGLAPRLGRGLGTSSRVHCLCRWMKWNWLTWLNQWILKPLNW